VFVGGGGSQHRPLMLMQPPVACSEPGFERWRQRGGWQRIHTPIHRNRCLAVTGRAAVIDPTPADRPARLPPWLTAGPSGLYCAAGGFFIDPPRPVDRAILTHGHADHARAGHLAALATPETLAILRCRWGEAASGGLQPLAYGAPLRIGDVRVTLFPAGHILGSAQVRIEHGGVRVVVSGDFKRRPDPTCTGFEPVACDIFVTEATFGLPVFRHPPDRREVERLLGSLALFPDRCHLIGVYALGKCQRLIRLLRDAGHDRPIHLHGALVPLCRLYADLGVDLGPLVPVAGAKRQDLAGEIVLCPPSALADRWSRAFPDPVIGMASGWMGVRQRARQRGAELPLVVSDHADWPELTATLADVGAPVVLVTHGREAALVHQARRQGFAAAALALAGYAEEGE
jgi:putative mRNA 3-end processing factor